MHECDFPKFYEAMSLFALAAVVNAQDEKQLEVFLNAIVACRCKELDARTVAVVSREKGSGASVPSLLNEVHVALRKLRKRAP